MKFSLSIIRQRMIFVAPYAGAWIEMQRTAYLNCSRNVAPYAGAWIEIPILRYEQFALTVAPYAGAWIEISVREYKRAKKKSLPTRERGLK